MNDRRRWSRVPLALCALAALTAGCLDPVEDAADEGAAESPLGSEIQDPAREELAAEVDRLVTLLADLQDRLVTAAAADDLASVEEVAARVEEGLIGDPGDGDVLFPVDALERGDVSERADLLTRTLTAAREAGDDDARAVIEGLRDLVAGDLGGWQRDAEGMVSWADEVAVEQGSMEETERRVLQLPGGGTQALAYVRLIDRTTSLERAQAYAERAAAHLEVARSVLADLEVGEDTDADEETDADDEQAWRGDARRPAQTAAGHDAGATHR